MVTTPGFALSGGLFGAGLNTATNLLGKRPLTQGLGQRFAQGYQGGAIAGPVVGATNPLLARAIGPIGGGSASRGAAGAANAFQGLGINAATGTVPTPQSIGFDIATGALGGKSTFGQASGLFGRAKEVDVNLKEVDALKDAWNTAKKADKPALLKTIRDAADRNLEPKLRDRYYDNPTMLIKKMQENLTSKHPQFQPTVLGFAGDTQPKGVGVNNRTGNYKVQLDESVAQSK